MLKQMPNTSNYRFYIDDTNNDVGRFTIRDDGKHLSIWAFTIYREYRGMGYGQQMLKEAIKVAGNNKLVLYVLKGNDRAIHIYKKLGFVITGEYMHKEAWKMTYKGSRTLENEQNLICCA